MKPGDPLIRIQQYLSERDEISTSQIAVHLSMNRNSAAKYLTMLQMLGRVEVRSYGKLRLYRLSKRIPFSTISEITDGIAFGIDRMGCVKMIGGRTTTKVNQALGNPFSSAVHPLFSTPYFSDQVRRRLDGREREVFRSTVSVGENDQTVKIIPSVFDDGTAGAAVTLENITDPNNNREDNEQWKETSEFLFGKSSDLVLFFSADKKITRMNPAFCTYFNMTQKEADAKGEFKKILQKLGTGDNTASTKIGMRDEEPLLQNWHVHPLIRGKKRSGYLAIGMDATTDPDQNLRSIHDLSMRLQKERELRERLSEKVERKNQELISILQKTSEYIWQTDIADTIISCSKEFAEILNSSPEQVRGRRIYDLISTESILEFRLLLSDTEAKNEERRWVETNFVTRDGREIPFLCTGTPIHSHDGKYRGFQCFGRDITREKKREEEQIQLTQLLKRIDTMIIIRDDHEEILFMNTRARQNLGIQDEKERYRFQVSQLLNIRSQKLMQKGSDLARQTGSWKGKIIFHTLSGEEIPTKTTILFHRASFLKKNIFTIIAEDIREKIWYEEEIADYSLLSEGLLKMITGPVMILDRGGMIMMVNASLCHLTGFSRDELVGMPAYELFPETEEDISHNPDGKAILREAGGRLIQVLLTRHNISERKDRQIHSSIVSVQRCEVMPACR